MGGRCLKAFAPGQYPGAGADQGRHIPGDQGGDPRSSLGIPFRTPLPESGSISVSSARTLLLTLAVDGRREARRRLVVTPAVGKADHTAQDAVGYLDRCDNRAYA